MRLLSPIVRGCYPVLYRGLHTGSRRVPLLIQPSELKSLPRQGVVALDVSWHMPTSDRNANEEFRTGPRLPGAQRFDIDKVAELRKDQNPLELTHMIPTKEVFADAVSRWGINNDTHVILYDTIGVFSSPRGAYTFKTFGHDKVSVLDGGLPRWIAEGGAVETGDVHKPNTAKYEADAPNTANVKTYEQMVANSSKAESSPETADVVLDARSPGRFEGVEPEPREGIESGHIPGSINVPFGTLLHEATEARPYTYFKDPKEVRKILVDAVGGEAVWNELQKDGGRSLVFTCGSGLTAGTLWLANQVVADSEGRQPSQNALYDESWTGYASRSQSKLAKGPAK